MTGLADRAPVWRDLQDTVDVAARASEGDLQTLIDHLYLHWYLGVREPAQPSGPPTPVDASPADALRAAHHESDLWLSGWVVDRPVNGDWIIVSRGSERRLVHRVDVVPDRRSCLPPRPGESVAVASRRDFVHDDGSCWSSASGNWEDSIADNGMSRLYWNVSLQHAPDLLSRLTRSLAGLVAGYALKVWLADTGRPDALVVYIRDSDAPVVLPAMLELHPSVRELLRTPSPRLTLHLAKGLGFAEDPGGGESFGQNRCRLVAQALGATAGEAEAHRVRAVAEHLSFTGVDLERPYLRPGSVRRYAAAAT